MDDRAQLYSKLSDVVLISSLFCLVYKSRTNKIKMKLFKFIDYTCGTVLILIVYLNTRDIPETVELESKIFEGYQTHWGYFCEGVYMASVV